ncbi:DUF4271 domain-containing protein [Olleya sp. UBA1516]|uniref:DUF4271 domain-containing protein n=1 Tax=Olleya sp. UBA1516 TaxID=1947013 RepID=UPI0025D58AE2|nr:DUF4271 domain-containing protein [Olleya sp. UBA1516]|tara:strand:- start:3429 stop:4079 length:651 start_codon:yes stop_codon:yes gene_type:complete
MLRDLYTVDILTLTFIGCLIIVALSKTLFTKRFNEFILLLFNSRHTNLYIKEQRFFDLFEGLLFLNFILNLGLLLHTYLNEQSLNKLPQLDVFKYALLIGLFLILKVLFERLLSSVLDIEPIIDKYIFEKTSFQNFVGLVLLPINALLIYTLTPNQTLLITLLTILLALQFFGLFLFIKNNLNVFRKSLFYFILYLCTLEIAPYVVLYKIITTNWV